MRHTITQRELRNSWAKIIAAVEAGETIIITRDGTEIAEVTPIRRRRLVPTSELRNQLSGLSTVDGEETRAESDEHFGEERN